jgi:hypothetical protein
LLATRGGLRLADELVALDQWVGGQLAADGVDLSLSDLALALGARLADREVGAQEHRDVDLVLVQGLELVDLLADQERPTQKGEGDAGRQHQGNRHADVAT